jgi:hypothetical protein
VSLNIRDCELMVGFRVPLSSRTEWFEKAAASGDARALSNLGWFEAAPKDELRLVGPPPTNAREEYERAAAKGDANAMFNLGALYENGQGVAQDYAKASTRLGSREKSTDGNVRYWPSRTFERTRSVLLSGVKRTLLAS